MKNILIIAFLLATTLLNAQHESLKQFEGEWECEYSTMPMSIKIVKNKWLQITTFTPDGEIDFVEIYVKSDKEAKRAEKYADRKKLYNKTLVYKRKN
tara:strand:- start:659 stop:949 length:291 start_codon:yes stop_codon:yes gene_type:complete